MVAEPGFHRAVARHVERGLATVVEDGDGQPHPGDRPACADRRPVYAAGKSKV
ncbi:hypothetical protein [Kitasatospora sp. NPDC087314]|uniref:hypothetical protein n=1 Tax=Kitasatospora sp. NPDC087314 TaxID=3364068 RepID=UPI0037FDD79A